MPALFPSHDRSEPGYFLAQSQTAAYGTKDLRKIKELKRAGIDQRAQDKNEIIEAMRKKAGIEPGYITVPQQYFVPNDPDPVTESYLGEKAVSEAHKNLRDINAASEDYWNRIKGGNLTGADYGLPDVIGYTGQQDVSQFIEDPRTGDRVKVNLRDVSQSPEAVEAAKRSFFSESQIAGEFSKHNTKEVREVIESSIKEIRDKPAEIAIANKLSFVALSDLYKLARNRMMLSLRESMDKDIAAVTSGKRQKSKIVRLFTDPFSLVGEHGREEKEREAIRKSYQVLAQNLGIGIITDPEDVKRRIREGTKKFATNSDGSVAYLPDQKQLPGTINLGRKTETLEEFRERMRMQRGGYR